MPGLIAHLSRSQQRELFADLNYLNLAELRGFCREHSIPFAIHVETDAGELRRSRDTDRKSVVLERVRRYLNTGRVPAPTCFPARVVRPAGAKRKPRASDRLYYGSYDKHDPAFLALLQQLTDGQFRSGAVARILAREFWTAGKAPTFREFARAWTRAQRRGLGVARGEHPEAAWLTDRARGETGPNWKAERARRARSALRLLQAIRRPG